ncbi:cytochrome b [Kordiimonas sp. SCSIO 12603]|uniref:cytochrome b n=1 Tax=Kordiimonas sp. SCSIO 12603 TaxID=2829596 RepID=UPI0021029EBF|nr:cytochrome b [Kordiimonas sp. SCSIO 12603]UTW58128.1 cytochrome b [Kordiimonas sp. SCSIO 12603]
MKDTFEKFSGMTVALHWLVGLSIIGLIAVGIYMEENEVYALYDIHKAFGVSIFAFILYRVFWRIKNGWPTPVGDYSKIEHLSAKVIHYVLIIGTLLFPISGMIYSGFGGYGIDVFGLQLVAENLDPNNAEEFIAHNETIASLGKEIHGILGDVMIIAILLHIAGALKHHVMDKDGTLKRMLGKSI